MTDDNVTWLAERIIKICSGEVTPDRDQIGIMDMLESLLREAMKDVEQKTAKLFSDECDVFHVNKVEAYTRAAEVARNLLPEGYSNVAAAIEKLREETK